MKKIHLFLLSLLSGLLLSVGWFTIGSVFVLFLAFVPLLIVEDYFFHHQNKLKPGLLFLFSYLCFFVWNICTSWWIKNASLEGGAMAVLSNSLFMTITFVLFHRLKKRVGEKWNTILFICCWITFEFIHLHWDLSWTWLNLGNGFANTIFMIQWYEYTGTFGGTLWILAMNILIFNFIKTYKTENKKLNIRKAVVILSVLILPIFISSVVELFATKFSKGGIKVVVVQPNIDPYNEKFRASFQEQVQKMMTLAEQKIDSTTQYVIFPETALTEDIWENKISDNYSIQYLKTFLKKYPQLKIVIGANTAKLYQEGETLSETARKFTNADAYYDAYNTALQIDISDNIQIYHKSKLVPGVEKMPFPFLFKPLEKFAIDLGGTIGSLGIQNERTVFFSTDKQMSTAPVICYESVYGAYVGDYIKNGAQFISIITNDGWWGDTPGYKQHLQFAKLRAIETRKWIARSANTGTSCFINPTGEISQATQWWTTAVIAQNIQLGNKQTFYTKHGDYIAHIAFCIAIAMLIYSLLIRNKIIKKQ